MSGVIVFRPKKLMPFILLIGLLFLFIMLTVNLDAEKDKAVRELESIRKKNIELTDEIEKLKADNRQLNSQLQKQKLMSLEEKTGLVRIQDIDGTIVTDMRYATKNNFTGQQLYPVALALLQRGTANKLKAANERVKRDGFGIKVWDAYRPLDVQKKLWSTTPDRRYVANPAYGSKHNRGSAVDVTLVNDTGDEVEMPTEFDHFSKQAWRSYTGNTPGAQRNMEYLGRVMAECGFIPSSTEWWHFDDSAWKSYPVINVGLEEFVVE